MANNNKMYLTKDGLKKLQNEYNELITSKRKEIAEKIASARELGDLSENSAWQQARTEQSFLEGRILELEEIFKNVEIIEKKHSQGVISLGSKVVVHIDGDEEEFHIVGAPEANPKQKKISHESPLGKALVGRKVGDVVEIEAPIGKIKYKIIKIT